MSSMGKPTYYGGLYSDGEGGYVCRFADGRERPLEFQAGHDIHVDTEGFSPEELLFAWDYGYVDPHGAGEDYRAEATAFIRAIKAEAWDEGRSAGHHDRDNYRLHHNPYR